MSFGHVWLLPWPRENSGSICFRRSNIILEAKGWKVNLTKVSQQVELQKQICFSSSASSVMNRHHRAGFQYCSLTDLSLWISSCVFGISGISLRVLPSSINIRRGSSSMCTNAAELAGCWGSAGGSFVLLLSATLLFTLTHRNSSPVSMAFVSTLPSVDTRKQCSSLESDHTTFTGCCLHKYQFWIFQHSFFSVDIRDSRIWSLIKVVGMTD